MTAIEMETRARLLDAMVCDLDDDARMGIGVADLPAAFVAYEVAEQAYRNLGDVLRFLANRIGEAMAPEKTVRVGGATFTRHGRRAAAKCIDDSGLWRLILDHRMVDGSTGEVIPQHEVIKRVYGTRSKETGEVRLTGATPSKLDAIGIPSGDFFEKADWDGWTIVVSR